MHFKTTRNMLYMGVGVFQRRTEERILSNEVKILRILKCHLLIKAFCAWRAKCSEYFILFLPFLFESLRNVKSLNAFKIQLNKFDGDLVF